MTMYLLDEHSNSVLKQGKSQLHTRDVLYFVTFLILFGWANTGDKASKLRRRHFVAPQKEWPINCYRLDERMPFGSNICFVPLQEMFGRGLFREEWMLMYSKWLFRTRLREASNKCQPRTVCILSCCPRIHSALLFLCFYWIHEINPDSST